MKRLLALVIFAIAIALGNTAESKAQVIVKVRPTRPAHVVVVKPAVRRNHIWVAAHWKWDKRRNTYVWVDG